MLGSRQGPWPQAGPLKPAPGRRGLRLGRRLGSNRILVMWTRLSLAATVGSCVHMENVCNEAISQEDEQKAVETSVSQDKPSP